jgi:hypothetical protein
MTAIGPTLTDDALSIDRTNSGQESVQIDIKGYQNIRASLELG